MNHTLLNEEEATRVRERFEKTFIETPQEYALSTAKWREETFAGNPNAHVYPTPNYDEVIYWSKIKSYKEIDFADAISFLSNIGNPVYFMSDPELEGCVGMHLLNSDSDSIGFVAVHNDSKEFAEYIFYTSGKSYTLHPTMNGMKPSFLSICTFLTKAFRGCLCLPTTTSTISNPTVWKTAATVCALSSEYRQKRKTTVFLSSFLYLS